MPYSHAILDLVGLNFLSATPSFGWRTLASGMQAMQDGLREGLQMSARRFPRLLHTGLTLWIPATAFTGTIIMPLQADHE